jgi:hypothetical protein
MLQGDVRVQVTVRHLRSSSQMQMALIARTQQVGAMRWRFKRFACLVCLL